RLPNVTFQVADAYSLQGVEGPFTAALAIWWWSHVPVNALRGFLDALHGKMQSGALVCFVDQLPYSGAVRRLGAEGDTLEQRTLPDGRRVEIVKNFPTRRQVESALHDIAANVHYVEDPNEMSWRVTYSVVK
ncbi:MAG: class I SAM-dependent methyltransferase, partial [Phycisphaeraceae bacterium]|nr:class I SAM-dependent methyltransferase [Phycisphaeraceae bacterium]